MRERRCLLPKSTLCSLFTASDGVPRLLGLPRDTLDTRADSSFRRLWNCQTHSFSKRTVIYFRRWLPLYQRIICLHLHSGQKKTAVCSSKHSFSYPKYSVAHSRALSVLHTIQRGMFNQWLFVLDFPIYLQSVEIHSAYGVFGGEGGRGVLCSTPLIKGWKPHVAFGKKWYKLRKNTN
jgi:hypothetical protein